jgi:hypothetical protein
MLGAKWGSLFAANPLPRWRISIFHLLQRGKLSSHPCQSSDAEAKFWLELTIELARNIGLNSTMIQDVKRLAGSRQQEIIDAWANHFGG